ncbi:MAG: hypothetical protein H7Y03_08810 [Chitinophagaceae bacterium]|nr:hypothetical protein [Chitinophagaceae bacterium]
MKVLLLILLSLLYIVLCTLIFEYTINTASDTSLTLTGIITWLVISFFYFRYLFKNLKKLKL